MSVDLDLEEGEIEDPSMNNIEWNTLEETDHASISTESHQETMEDHDSFPSPWVEEWSPTMETNQDMCIHDPDQTNIWDDTALIRAWDDALAMYKKCRNDVQEGKTPTMDSIEPSIVKKRPIEDSEPCSLGIKARKVHPEKKTQRTIPPLFPVQKENDHSFSEPTTLPSSEATHSFSASVACQKQCTVCGGCACCCCCERSVCSQPSLENTETPIDPLTSLSEQEEDLGRLMMAWYYSGYYTGLFHGRYPSLCK